MNRHDSKQEDNYLVGCKKIVCVDGASPSDPDSSFLLGRDLLITGKTYDVVDVGTWLVSVVDETGVVRGYDKRRFEPVESESESECVTQQTLISETSEAYFERMKKNKLFGIF